MESRKQRSGFIENPSSKVVQDLESEQLKSFARSSRKSSPPNSIIPARGSGQPLITLSPVPCTTWRSGRTQATDDDEPPLYELPSIDTYSTDFAIKEQLGQGAFGAAALLEVMNDRKGSVPREFKLSQGTLIVAKRIRTKNPKENWNTKFDKEWEAFKAFAVEPGHNNIVAGWCVEHPRNSHPWGHIFMEYCDLGDLRSLCEVYWYNADTKDPNYLLDTLLPEELVYEITASVAAGLAWMHHGVQSWRHLKDYPKPQNWTPWMHNDLKADNIFLKSRVIGDNSIWPIIKIGDLGAATDIHTPAMIGNHQALSPDRVKTNMQAPATPADDIFGLGAMMYALANRSEPFTGYEKVHHLAVDTHGRTIGGPPNCVMPKDVYHAKVRKMSDEGVWKGCWHTERPTFNNRVAPRIPSPYAPWWNQLIEDCISIRAEERPDAMQVSERIWQGIRENGFSSQGSRKVLWDHDWLEEEVYVLDDVSQLKTSGNDCILL